MKAHELITLLKADPEREVIIRDTFDDAEATDFQVQMPTLDGESIVIETTFC